MFRTILLASLAAFAATGAALADGRKGGPSYEARPAAPLRTGQAAPSGHYVSTTPDCIQAGDHIYSSTRPGPHTVNCAGAWVVTDNVVSFTSMNGETVPAIIHPPGAAHDDCDRPCPKTAATTPVAPQPAQPSGITLSSGFGDGGVGAGVSGGYGGGGRVIVVNQHATTRGAAVTYVSGVTSHRRHGGGGHSCGGCN